MDEHEETLRDGTRALVRPITPDDKTRLQEGLRLLSPRSRYLRFHAPVSRFTDEQLSYLTDVDYRDHMALVAVNPDEPDEPGMGVARYVRLPAEPTVAEAAVTVLDHYQGRGVGTLLLRWLTASAAGNGITTLRNYVLAENTAMLDIVDTLGATRFDEGHGVLRIEVPVEDAHERRSSARKVLRGIARGVVAPPRVLITGFGAPASDDEDEAGGSCGC